MRMEESCSFGPARRGIDEVRAKVILRCASTPINFPTASAFSGDKNDEVADSSGKTQYGRIRKEGRTEGRTDGQKEGKGRQARREGGREEGRKGPPLCACA